ncbi:MAG: hypothetical protein CO029_01830 [Candidatus Magasanikbacteria bacterium CG_4_9_14_0_2_um_filter_41_10]|uniref:VCBS repeat-containing protein n=1 Tax=Candidatus Magasanikbacteria bacterium CG_4_10_14_0_2_um_filter_41_31 TaxID=1974639 RepID=A0A2M7V3L4_9BACT|nr:MAG: hypothetical protein AUJ37_01160 [Candidatus Magasanikbacteria bacterium CG1_02_41_34]PIZ92991.1 MAG: hypothetical protein COX83_03000 [Candidatus Magasanikbacteria bacterium CG_4_10_14_0_2_um_filter_41_31]PJC53616.1 MAG: hypothetical protein CO029_01830 [Candidatus Magasanikbacteria bacterium CG_4_9_14_0_2_um_filter_41_10]
MILRSKHNIIFFFTIFCILFFVPRIVVFAQIAPRTVNYYLSWTIPHEDAQKLADWDMLILDMEQQVKNPDLLKQLRQKNPDIILLAYITPQEILKNASSVDSTMRKKLISNIHESMYLYDTTGKKLTYWPGTYLLNMTSASVRDTISDFVAQDILSSGLWDGVFYDNAWGSLDWAIPGGNVDFDRNGTNDLPGSGNAVWTEATRHLYQETRKKIGKDAIMVGNGWTDIYADVLDGMMIEGFDEGNWTQHMTLYRNNHRPGGSYNIINVNTENTGLSADYRAMRFGLTSSLLEDGYYSFDFGNQNHGQTWAYDEYAVHLGNATGIASSDSGVVTYNPDVWRREYEQGISVVNSTGQTKQIDLGGEYEKIHGIQDLVANDGSIISELTLDGYDGRVLLKTFDSLDDVLFPNGAFLRFFRNDGSRVRNGFFVFEDGYKGGDQVAHIDLNGDGLRDLFVVAGNKILAWRHDGQPYINPLYPYTANYKGALRVMIGDINNDNNMEVYVAPESGYPAPIKVYTRYGFPLRQDWFPFGETYNGGYTLALAGSSPVETKHILLGSGTGVEPRVGIYTWDYKFLNSWLAFEKSFTGGVNVAAGDVNGDDIDEVVVGAGKGKGPLIRVFNENGIQQGEDISAYASVEKTGIDVRVQDVDFDGNADIIGMSNDGF